MYGFIKRLDAWVRDAALNNLDPNDAPLHPPVAYPTVYRLFVPIADTPLVNGSPWFGVAELRERNHRTEIIGWKERGREHSAQFAPAILLHEDLPFEYPETVHTLLKELDSHGIEYAPFILQLAECARHSDMAAPLTVVLGTPMRRVLPGGPALQHLAVWQISPEDSDKLRQLSISLQANDTAQGTAAIQAVVNWSLSARVGWCVVREMRPEVTTRRDHSSPVAWLRGKRIAIWGCGAVGTHVAESIVRAGARAVELVDNKPVTPGLLIRQGFEDADVGRLKALALSDRLKRINPDLETIVSAEDLIIRIAGPDPLPQVDLLIDCTASLAVRTALERRLSNSNVDSRPAIASIAIDSQATAAIATLSTPSHTGGTLDLLRRLKLEACRRPRLSKPLEAFWPKSAPLARFQPEPGCSEPTFIGSNADLAGLSARMLNSLVRAIAQPPGSRTGMGWLCEGSGPVHAFAWPPDQTLRDKGRGYSIRVCSHAAREMRGWARRSARVVGATVETGGLVFGELSEAAGVLWVTDVDGPPPDSHADEDHFTCGTEGTKVAAQGRQRRFRGSVDCIGTWHTHPTSEPLPSSLDLTAVAQLLSSNGAARRTVLLLILSREPDDPALGAYAFRATFPGESVIRLKRSAAGTAPLGPRPDRPRNVGLALSGGGSRAMAFHLGCLRALHDLELLGRVQVMSSVSGGSVISAMYAYSREPFREFDARVAHLLRRGFHRDILRELFTPISVARALAFHVTSVACLIYRMFRHLVRAAPRQSIPAGLFPYPRRAFSRTEAFRTVVAKSLFGDITVRDVARDSLHTVINATELRSGSAFRFGSQESGCWRFGTTAPDDALVADAVASSAAHPAYLPALDRTYRFTKNGSTSDPTPVLLTDGGVFENLGVSPMEPGRTSTISTNVFNPDYIICCDAGTGLFDDDTCPTYWPSRMFRSFGTIFRRVQDATRKRLHYLAEGGEISGFALCYLGQQDHALPWMPAGLPKREEVSEYPTDFAAMSPEDIDRLALRGELLMRFLVSHYLPDV